MSQTALLLAVVAMLAVIAGIALCLLGVFGYFLLRGVNKLNNTLDEVGKTVRPLVEDQGVLLSIRALRDLAMRLPEMVTRFEAGTEVMGKVAQALFAKQTPLGYEDEAVNAAAAVPFGRSPGGQGKVFLYDESQAAEYEETSRMQPKVNFRTPPPAAEKVERAAVRKTDLQPAAPVKADTPVDASSIAPPPIPDIPDSGAVTIMAVGVDAD